jgi:cytoskeletal protein RodZ
MQNDPDRLYLAKKISRSFRHDEDAVMQRLEEIYSSGGPKKLTYKELSKSTSTTSSTEVENDLESEGVVEASNEALPKKKGKLKMVIVLVIAIAVLGGGGYFGYNMYMGASHDESHDDSHEQTNHDDDQSSEETHVNDSIVKDVEAKIEEAEKGDQKDSTIEDIKDAAEAIHLIAH